MKTNLERIFKEFLAKNELRFEWQQFKFGRLIFHRPCLKRKFPIFTIVPSFKCNTNCNYCQYKGLIKNHPDMDTEIFLKVIQWLCWQNIKYIRLMGGEITTNPQVNNYLKIINDHGMWLRFFSNLLVDTKRLRKILSDLKPERVEHFIIHYKDLKWYNKKKHALFLKNVKKVNDCGYTIHLRHNLIDRNTEYDYAIDLARKYDIKFFTTTPLFPGATGKSIYTSIEEWRALIPNIIDIYKKCAAAGITFDFTKPLPPCFFSDEDFKKYYHKLNSSGLGGRNPCLTDDILFMPVVYPNQVVVFCPGVHLKAPKLLLEYTNYREIYYDLKDEFEKIRWTPLFEKCNKCKFFRHRLCQGLCTGFKFYKHAKMKENFVTQ